MRDGRLDNPEMAACRCVGGSCGSERREINLQGNIPNRCALGMKKLLEDRGKEEKIFFCRAKGISNYFPKKLDFDR